MLICHDFTLKGQSKVKYDSTKRCAPYDSYRLSVHCKSLSKSADAGGSNNSGGDATNEGMVTKITHRIPPVLKKKCCKIEKSTENIYY